MAQEEKGFRGIVLREEHDRAKGVAPPRRSQSTHSSGEAGQCQGSEGVLLSNGQPTVYLPNNLNPRQALTLQIPHSTMRSNQINTLIPPQPTATG